MTRSAILALAAALLLAGCESRPAYEAAPLARQETEAAPAARTPAMPPSRPAPRAVVTAGPVGMLAENRVDRYMDEQETQLRQRLRGTGVGVRRVADDMVLVLPSDILFPSNARSLNSRAIGTIDTVAEVLRHYDRTLIDVNGYTDTTGSPQYNQKVSQARAEAVADVLVDDGVNAARISPRGFGETHLRVPTGDNTNEPRNRRVEIRIVPHVAKG